MQEIDEFKALLVKYKAHSSLTDVQCHRRNVLCVPISAAGPTLYDNNFLFDAVLDSIRAVLGVDTHVVPDRRTSADETDQIRQLLGNEFSALVIDGTGNWPDNVLGAACGAVRTPGLLILLLPNGTRLIPGASPYEQHLKRGLRRYLTPCPTLPDCATLYSLEPDRASAGTMALPVAPPGISRWKAEQQAVIPAILSNTRHENRTLDIILARRGRGKSAVLGQLIDRYFRLSAAPTPPSITLTASHPNQVRPVLKHINKADIGFTPLDKALRNRGSYLFIDEAGSIPVPVLRQLTQRYEHTIMAGTVDGYEGSGRALSLVFSASVARDGQAAIQTRFHTLTHPVRWPAGDKLEAMCNDLLCLDSLNNPALENKPPFINPSSEHPFNDIRHERLTSQQLLNDAALLKSVFGLLLQAHYQTSSRDLKHLLNQSRLSVLVQSIDGQITAAALIAQEGALPQDEVTGIICNTRRPAHQRLPVLLYQQCRAEPILRARHWRVIRIAVHPELQQRGLGTRLLNFVAQAPHHSPDLAAPDIIGATFGATHKGLNFWLHAGYRPMQWGFRLNPRSGQRAVTVAMATDTSGEYATNLCMANAQLLDTVQALKTLKQVQPVWLDLLYGETPFNSATLEQLTKPTHPDTLRQPPPTTDALEQNDAQRIELWRRGDSSLHDSWGPVIRRAGGAEAVSTWQFPNVKNAKHLTQLIQQRLP